METVAGGAAGDLTVTGIKEGDVLKSVLPIDEASINLVDQFSITGDDTINNEGGDSTAEALLLVVWIARDERGGHLDRT
jgi:hypothetical protein